MSGRLLLDENLSPRIARALATQFPGSVHVRDVELKGQSDHIIWNFAAKNGFTIATKDDDFRSLSLLQGPPPKVIWLVIENTSTAHASQALTAVRITCQGLPHFPGGDPGGAGCFTSERNARPVRDVISLLAEYGGLAGSTCGESA